MAAWSRTIPADLRRRLEAVLRYRNCEPPEIWTELVEWFEVHGVEPPAGLDEPEAPWPSSAQQD